MFGRRGRLGRKSKRSKQGSGSAGTRGGQQNGGADKDGVQVSEASKRDFVKSLWISCGKPQPCQWRQPGDGTISYIVGVMHPNVLKGSKDRARRYVADKLAVLCTADDAGIDLDIRGRKPGSGGHNRKMRAEDCSHDIALRDLMDWRLAQSKKMFKGTTHEKDFWLMTDGLLQWWHP